MRIIQNLWFRIIALWCLLMHGEHHRSIWLDYGYTYRQCAKCGQYWREPRE